MNPNPLAPNLMHLLNQTPVSPPSSTTTRRTGTEHFTGGFSNILEAAFGNVEETDHQDRVSRMQLLMGEADDLSGLLIDAQKAELALQLALQIRNKLIDAYTEILRMQV